MSSETATDADTKERTRPEEAGGFLTRLRKSPFLSDLLSNRLALAGMVIILTMVVIAVYAKLFIAYEPLTKTQFGTNPPNERPGVMDPTGGLRYPFGTNNVAQDMFPRVLYGAWLALKFGTIIVGISTFLGVSLGVIAAYYGDVTDNVIMRTMDILLAFPSLLLALALVAIFPNKIVVTGWVEPYVTPILGKEFTLGLWRGVAALILVYTPRFARVVRGAALKVLEDEFIDATVALGATNPRVLARHVVPNTLAPITVQSTLNFGLAIIDLAALSFLGFGAEAGSPSWGLMLSNGVDFGLLSGNWWWSFFPGLFLAVTVLGFNLLGDGMRDALDPRMRVNVR